MFWLMNGCSTCQATIAIYVFAAWSPYLFLHLLHKSGLEQTKLWGSEDLPTHSVKDEITLGYYYFHPVLFGSSFKTITLPLFIFILLLQLIHLFIHLYLSVELFMLLLPLCFHPLHLLHTHHLGAANPPVKSLSSFLQHKSPSTSPLFLFPPSISPLLSYAYTFIIFPCSLIKLHPLFLLLVKASPWHFSSWS